MLCAIGSWGGRRLRLGGEVTVTGARGGRPLLEAVNVAYGPRPRNRSHALDMNGYLAEAKLAVVHVQKKTPLGTYNQIRDTTRQPLMLPFRIMMRGAQILRENQEVAKLTPGASYERKIEILAEAGKRGMSGNCSEMAAIAFLFLSDRGIRPLDYMCFNGKDHAFVILGRPAGSIAGDFSSWADKSVACDPLRGEAGIATQLAVWWNYSKCASLFRKE